MALWPWRKGEGREGPPHFCGPRNFPLNLTVKFPLKLPLKNKETGKKGGGGWGEMGEMGGKGGNEGGGWWGKYVVDPKGVANLCTLRKISENVGASMCW